MKRTIFATLAIAMVTLSFVNTAEAGRFDDDEPTRTYVPRSTHPAKTHGQAAIAAADQAIAAISALAVAANSDNDEKVKSSWQDYKIAKNKCRESLTRLELLDDSPTKQEWEPKAKEACNKKVDKFYHKLSEDPVVQGALESMKRWSEQLGYMIAMVILFAFFCVIHVKITADWISSSKEAARKERSAIQIFGILLGIGLTAWHFFWSVNWPIYFLAILIVVEIASEPYLVYLRRSLRSK